MTQPAVTNSTCLIGLERIGQLDLLPQVFPVIFAPPTVVVEVRSTLSWLRVQAKQIGLKVIGKVGMLLYQIRVSYPRYNPVRAGGLCLCSSDFNRLFKRLGGWEDEPQVVGDIIAEIMSDRAAHPLNQKC
ncbi:MAG: hypothetical protein RID53_17195 [Coleofasciculus sp. B1-GNL1-01]|uniref:hypothetical protein n=1 Tax=Coleofasciculus sp. B1-GNL1-01 TaxID=3068484 RepID=UPI003301BC48